MISNEEHAKVVELVYAHDYYLHIFNTVRKYYSDRNMKMNTPYFWNDFWISFGSFPLLLVRFRIVVRGVDACGHG